MLKQTLRLSQREKDILAYLELDTGTPIADIARKLRCRTHTVQYLLNKMRQRQIFKPVTYVDIHKLGLRYCGVFLSLRGSSVQLRRFIAKASRHTKLGWFAEVTGAFQFGLALATTTPKEADSEIQGLISDSGLHVAKKATSFRLELVDLPRGYLSAKLDKRSYISMSDGVDTVSISDLDRRILQAFDQHPWESHRGVARILGVPQSSLELRINRMKQLGVIKGSTVELDLGSMGRECRKLLIYTRDRSERFSRELLEWATLHPLVSHFICCFGEWDYEMNAEVLDSAELNNLCQELYHKFPDNIVSVEPLSIVRVHRFTRTPLGLSGS